jgi:predicted dehydrogenase
MRQLFLDKGLVLIKNVTEPVLEDHMALVAVQYSCIDMQADIASLNTPQTELFNNVPYKIKKVLSCITSCGVPTAKSLVKHSLQGDLQPLGYSCCGRIIAVGKRVTQFRAGDLVACAGATFAHHAEIVCVPEYLMAKISNPSVMKVASMTAVGGVAVHGVRRAQLSLGDVVAVFGLGLVGQLTAVLAKASGCTVIAIDEQENRLEQAKKLGADYVYHAVHDAITQKISLVTQHAGVDVSFVTGVSEKENTLLQQLAGDATRAHGKMVIVGQGACTVHRHQVQKKNLSVLLCPYTPGKRDFAVQCYQQDRGVFWTEQRTMQEFVRLLESGTVHIDDLLGGEISFEQVPEFLERRQPSYEFSIVIAYKQMDQASVLPVGSEAEQKSQKSLLRFIPAVKNKEHKIRVGIIGAGRFARLKLMPLLADMRGISLDAVVDIDRTRALNVARVYGIDKVYTADDALFADDKIDAVIIASPFTLHAQQVLKALRHGKAVFVEKPLITDVQHYEQIKKILEVHPQAPLCVGYNASYSPFMQKIKKHIADRYTPLMISCRMNPGLVPQEFWIHADLSVGKILGHACGIFDLFCYLTESKPVSVSVEALHASKADIFPTDNFCVQISFEDGSVCSLLYTTLGHQDLGKERFEIFFDGKSILMNNYNQLLGFGFPALFNETVSAPDKGHKAVLQAFFDALRKPQYVPPISFDRVKRVAELTLLVDKLVCSGGGSTDFVPAKTVSQTETFGGAHMASAEEQEQSNT